MVYWEPSHDEGAKTLLNGAVSPAGLNADQDLDFALDNIFNHPNVGPFVATNLIKELVTSNPSPAYVARVAAAFADNGGGVRGDMRAVIKAVLLDPEARKGDDWTVQSSPEYSSFGSLKEPVLFFAETLRGMGALVNDSNTLAARGNALGQNIFVPPTVFSYFSPFYKVQGTGGLEGPEFQIDSRSIAIERANQINTLIYGTYGNGATVDLGVWSSLAKKPADLADTILWTFFYSSAPPELRNQLISAITGTTGTTLDKAKAGLYVALTSGYYAVRK
jgi:hypothetical protein